MAQTMGKGARCLHHPVDGLRALHMATPEVLLAASTGTTAMTDLELATTVSGAVLSNHSDAPIAHLLLVASLPRPRPHLTAFELAAAIETPVPHVLDVGQTCAAILDAIYLAFVYGPAQPTMVVVADTPSRSFPVEASACDAAAAVLFNSTQQDWCVSALSYVTAVDPRSAGEVLFSHVSDGYRVKFGPRYGELLRGVDLETDVGVCQSALAAADVGASEIDAIVVTNRRVQRTEELRRRLGIEPRRVFASRECHGHSGGSDVIFNLRDALAILHGGSRVLLSANGLGYSWGAMVLQIDRT